MSKFTFKDIIVSGGAGSIDLTTNDAVIKQRIDSQLDQNLITIQTESTPAAGTFDCFVEFGENTGFFGVTPIGGAGTAIDATKVGSGVTDGDAEGWSFNGSPSTIRVTATGVTDGTYTVVVSQNHG